MEEWRKKLINEGDKNQAFDYIEYLEEELMKCKKEELDKVKGVTSAELERAIDALKHPIEVGNTKFKYFDADNYDKIEKALLKAILLVDNYDHLINLKDEHKILVDFIKDRGLYDELIESDIFKEWEKEDIRFYDAEVQEANDSATWWQNRYNALKKQYDKLTWRPISEYSTQKYDWVLCKYIIKDDGFECIPAVMEKRLGMWYMQNDEPLDENMFEVTHFFDIQGLYIPVKEKIRKKVANDGK